MPLSQISEFGATAKGLSRKPLSIIALFIVLVYGLACIVVITGGSLSASERLPVIYFLVLFPVLVLGVFTYLVAFRAGQLFHPGDFKEEGTYLELQKMQMSAVVNLTTARHHKASESDKIIDPNIDAMISSVQTATTISKLSLDRPILLWVDDRPNNNIYERRAFEAVGIEIILSENTDDALAKLAIESIDVVISDMGRREGPREGYVLLDKMRRGGDYTPLFFFASSNAPEHVMETYEHGGQGCTNDGQELFEMVTKNLSAGANPRGRKNYSRRNVNAKY